MAEGLSKTRLWVLTGFNNKKAANLGLKKKKKKLKLWDGKHGEMEVANADHNFKKFRSEGVKEWNG